MHVICYVIKYVYFYLISAYEPMVKSIILIKKCILKIIMFCFLEKMRKRTSVSDQCPNLIKLIRVWNPPKTGFNWAPALILKNVIQFLVDPTIFKPLLKLFKFGLWFTKVIWLTIYIIYFFLWCNNICFRLEYMF